MLGFFFSGDLYFVQCALIPSSFLTDKLPLAIAVASSTPVKKVSIRKQEVFAHLAQVDAISASTFTKASAFHLRNSFAVYVTQMMAELKREFEGLDSSEGPSSPRGKEKEKDKERSKHSEREREASPRE